MQGDIPLPDEIASFYQEVGPLGEQGRKGHSGISVPCFGNDVELVPLAGLWKAQAGYRWDGRTNEPIEDWPSQWIALAWEGANAYIFDSNTKSMLFSLAGGGADDVHEIGGSPTDVVDALASFGQKVEDAGDDAMTDDFELRPEWLESVQKELVAEFGNGGDGVVRILTEI